ncbi:MAG: hypothetical protein RR686_18330 [Morganella sp. (in: enterobacteria)]
MNMKNTQGILLAATDLAEKLEAITKERGIQGSEYIIISALQSVYERNQAALSFLSDS